MRTYLLVETEKMPVGHRGLLTTFHGIFDNLDAAKQGLRTVAEALLINPQAAMPQYILDKHYNRKHGKNAYYGQK